jgi:hypothetical protein
MPFLNLDAAQTPVLPAFMRHMTLGHPEGCCAPAKDKTVPVPVPAPIVRRSKLSDLDDYVHCSIIGTCMSCAELRKLVPRYDAAIDRKASSDLDIHHAAVNLTTKSELVAKEVTKALDIRHAQAIRRFKNADAPGLAELWREAMASGDVPGAYWALMTHPLSTFELRTQAFGDVHMLSHLVGASNRADLRRLAALDDECAVLRAQHAAQQLRLQQLRLQQLGDQHRKAVALADAYAVRNRDLQSQLTASAMDDAARELADARAALTERDAQLALLNQRCAAAEARGRAGEQTLAEMRAERARQQEELAFARTEAQCLEDALARTLVPATAGRALPPLQDMTIAYVGGRRQSTQVLAKLVADAGGELLVHDGGLEDRKGLLASTLARATMVVFPVDCISHNAMHVAKQQAARSDIPCYPLRKASIAGFIELMRQVAV